MRTLLPVCLLLGASLLTGVALAQVQWEPDGVPIRQGVHLEWSRSAVADGAGGLIVTWSDCRLGDRDLFVQLFDENGDAQWDSGGVAVCTVTGRQEDPVIVTDGAGGGIIAWVDFRGGVEDVYAQRVDSDGQIVWAPEGVPLCTASAIQTGLRTTNDGSGGMIVAWQDFRDDASGDLYAQRVLGNGTIAPGWDPDGRPVTAEDGPQEAPSIDADELGGAIVAWADQRAGSNGWDIYGQRIRADGSAAWTIDGEPICDYLNDQEEPRLVRDSEHGVFVVWRDRRNASNGDIYGQRVDSTCTRLWDPDGLPICTESHGQEKPRVINDGASGAITIWIDHRSGSFQEDVYAQRLSGAGDLLWKVAGPDSLQGVPVCQAEGRQLEARLVSDGLAGTVVGWQDERNGSQNQDIYIQRMDSLGTPAWQLDGIPICDTTGAQGQPLLEPLGSGMTAIVWGDERDGSLAIYAEKVDLNGVTQWTEDGIQVHGGPAGNALYPSLVEGADRGALICWEDWRLGFAGARIYAQYVDTSGVTHWTKDGMPVCPDGTGSQTFPASAQSGDNGMVAAWVDRRSADKQIYAQRVDDTGSLLWGAAGVAVAPTSDDQEDVRIVNIGGSAFVCVWSDLRNGSFDVYGQLLDAVGTPQWGGGGVSVTSAPAEDERPYGVIEDMTGGVLVAWDGGTWDNHNVYLQRLDSGGTVHPGWPPEGVIVCEAAGNQENAQIVSDLAGGALLVWEDLRGSDLDLYASHVDSSGEIQWKVPGPDSLDGIPVVQEVNDQSDPSIVSDGAGGFVVVWQDFRNGGDYEIYGQWIDHTGAAQWDPGGVPIVSASESQSNPFVTGDSGDSMVVLWEDHRGGVWSDIYAQAVTDFGTGLWGPEGLGICVAAMDQSDPIGIGDALRGAIVLWQDMRASGKTELHDLYAQRLIESGVLVLDQGDLKEGANEVSLAQSFPNPFTHSAAIAYTVPYETGDGGSRGSGGAGARVSLRVYNIQGQLVKTLVEARQVPGRYRVEWDGRDDRENKLAAGVYFLRLEVGTESLNRKMILVR